VSRLGLGRSTAAGIVACIVFVLAVPLTATTLLQEGLSPRVVRLLGKARTLAATSVALTAVVSLVSGAGGAGPLIIQGIQTQSPAPLLGGFAIVFLLSLIVDLLLGFFQALAAHTSGP
jgi:ABC-type proline/glycine betaine transport system permease subunit